MMPITYKRRQRGQALLLAVIVLLMLSLLAASIVAVVAGSAKDTERDEASGHARSLALAGIRYADEMLTQATEGADWRPQLADYLTPGNPNFTQQAYDNTYDTFERLRGWDPVASGAPYYVKYRFAMDPDAPSQDPTVDPGQDFTDPDKTMPVENSEITAPHDHFLLRLEYAPNPAQPETKAIKITCVGRPGANTNVFDELVAYKPVGIQNYLLFVHDRTRRAAAAPLGVPGVDIDGDGAVASSARSLAAAGTWTASGNNDFLPLYLDGPVRSNLDLQVHPPVRIVTTGSGWNDSVEVSGGVSRQVEAAQTAGNTELLVSDNAGQPTAWDPNTNTTGTGLRVAVGAPRLEAPSLDAAEPVTGVSRFERLTRYSGDDVTVFQGTASVTVNSGEVGYGRGIYLDNLGQRDNLDGARQTWLSPQTWGGRRYVPNGALIELFENYTFPDASSGPAVVITRTDGSTWTNLTSGQPSGAPSLAFHWPAKTGTYARPVWGTANSDVPTVSPLPDNGVILAEGNVRIRGRLPVSAPATDYHLTVVSRGSIYIDGPLLRPSDYGAVAPAAANGPTNTRIALLARDHVVINPTVLAPGPLPGLTPGSFDSPRNNPLDSHYRLDAAGTQTVGVELPTGNTGNLRALAEVVDGDQNDGLDARAALLFANNRAQLGQMYAATGPWLINPDAGSNPEVPGRQGCQTPTFLGDLANLARALYVPNGSGQGTQEYMPDSWGLAAANFAPVGQSNWLTVQAGLDATGQGGSQSDVLLKNLKVERTDGTTFGPGLTMTVSALMFAERGTFFVIPGDWFDPRAQVQADVKDVSAGNASGTSAPERLARLKRFNYEVQVNGAVAVNNLAELADVAQWSDKWAYPTGAPVASLYYDYNTLHYAYDWGLRAVWPAGPRANLPLLPDLPLGTGLAYVGAEK